MSDLSANTEQALVDRCGQAVDRALAAGASGASARVDRSRDATWTYREGKLETVAGATSMGLSIQVYVDGRYGSHSTSDLRPAALDAFVRDAVALTRALQPDPDRMLPDPALFPKEVPDLGLVDADIASGAVLTRDARMARLVALAEAARGTDPRVISAESEVSDSAYSTAMVTSNGFQGAFAATDTWASASVTVRDEGDKKPEDSDYCGGRFLSDLVDPALVGARARELALGRLGSRKGPTREGVMVVDPRAAGSLVSRLLSSANARSIQQMQSFYTGKIGQKLFSDKLTIIDDPLVKGGLGSRPFDGEGIAARQLPIVEKGVVRNVYADTYYGRKAGLPVTTGGGSNRRLALGDRDLQAWLGDVKDAIYVTSWLGGNADPTTGDFSFGLRGFLVEGGKVTAPVGEMNITGNLAGLFAKLSGVGNDPFKYSPIAAPTLVFDGVSFSGA